MSTTAPKIYVAGHRGMVGSAIVRALQAMDCHVAGAPRNDVPDVTARRSGVISSEARQSMPPDSSLRGAKGDAAMHDPVPVVRIDPRYFRPTEVETLLGDPTKAKQKLGWVPEITAQQMCAEMVATDLAQAKQHALLKQHGYNVIIQ